jgi:ribosomal protein S18 acetylase RimI-like enzyme
MEITIRPAKARDYDELCQVIEQVDRLHRENLPHLFQQPAGPVRDPDYLLGVLVDPDHGLFVAEAGGRITGFVHAIIRDTPAIPIVVPRRLAIVDNLCVREGVRRAGIGQALMQRAQTWAQAQGAGEIELTVYEFNEPAIAFYQSLGYKTVSRRMTFPLV